ncbi:fimbrial protein [Providencia sp. PROV116]|uniref:fimbrial protein n=1 Tax=Providencia sp. PROV116 TaxID=2949827 RepID=UPI00234AC669|nr:fimbrial protein [Providencia sp. PROV116]
MIKQPIEIKRYLIPGVFSSVIFLANIVSLNAYASNSNEIQYSGTLIALPCTVNPQYENFEVFFGFSINEKDLANGRRFYSKEDILFRLDNCDVSMGNSISAKFSAASTTDAGLLNVDAISEASGIAIGLETPSGVALPINNTQVESMVPIKDGEMIIRLRSYLQAIDSGAINTVTPGFFSATLTYSLIYQ